MTESKQSKRVATKLPPLLHAEFIRATRLKNETMNGALCRFAKQYTEEVKSELLRTSVVSSAKRQTSEASKQERRKK
ncbi:MAG: hypothetical protein KBS54_04300 [Synergistaceae bacterium]|nr:hypothetical protein [Candidatus Equadaptatus faecalis]